MITIISISCVAAEASKIIIIIICRLEQTNTLATVSSIKIISVIFHGPYGMTIFIAIAGYINRDPYAVLASHHLLTPQIPLLHILQIPPRSLSFVVNSFSYRRQNRNTAEQNIRRSQNCRHRDREGVSIICGGHEGASFIHSRFLRLSCCYCGCCWRCFYCVYCRHFPGRLPRKFKVSVRTCSILEYPAWWLA